MTNLFDRLEDRFGPGPQRASLMTPQWAWAELRSVTEGCVREPGEVALLLLLLVQWPAEDEGGAERAEAYVRGKLSRIELEGPGGVVLWDVLGWCLRGYPALLRHFGMFEPIADTGPLRWLCVFCWACVKGHEYGLAIEDIQATATYRVRSGRYRQITLLLGHDGFVYMLDVQQGAQHLCMGIVSSKEHAINVKWPGFPEAYTHLAWHELAGGEVDSIDND